MPVWMPLWSAALSPNLAVCGPASRNLLLIGHILVGAAAARRADLRRPVEPAAASWTFAEHDIEPMHRPDDVGCEGYGCDDRNQGAVHVSPRAKAKHIAKVIPGRGAGHFGYGIPL